MDNFNISKKPSKLKINPKQFQKKNAVHLQKFKNNCIAVDIPDSSIFRRTPHPSVHFITVYFLQTAEPAPAAFPKCTFKCTIIFTPLRVLGEQPSP